MAYIEGEGGWAGGVGVEIRERDHQAARHSTPNKTDLPETLSSTLYPFPTNCPVPPSLGILDT